MGVPRGLTGHEEGSGPRERRAPPAMEHGHEGREAPRPGPRAQGVTHGRPLRVQAAVAPVCEGPVVCVLPAVWRTTQERGRARGEKKV